MLNKNLFLGFRSVFRATFAVIAFALLMCGSALGHTISGYINYMGASNNLIMVAGANVCVNTSPTPTCDATDEDGYWAITGLATGSYTISASKSGVNGAITSNDVSRLNLGMNNNPAFADSNQKVACDVSMNGSHTSFDAALITAYVNQSGSSGHTGEWHFYIESDPTFPLNGSPETDGYYVDGNMTNINFTGILIGDCDRSWTWE